LAEFPDQSTLRRFLQRLTPRTIRQLVRLHDQLRRRLFAQPRPPSRLIFNVDSVVLTPTANNRAPALVTTPASEAAVRIIRCCASRRAGRNSGTARCARATQPPTAG
jgi:hypothetical protein